MPLSYCSALHVGEADVDERGSVGGGTRGLGALRQLLLVLRHLFCRRFAQAPLLLRVGARAQSPGRETEIENPFGFGRQPGGQRELGQRRVVRGAAQRAGGLPQPQHVEAMPVGEPGRGFDATDGLGPAVLARIVEQQLFQCEGGSGIVSELGITARQQLQPILRGRGSRLGAGIDDRAQLARRVRAIVGEVQRPDQQPAHLGVRPAVLQILRRPGRGLRIVLALEIQLREHFHHSGPVGRFELPAGDDSLERPGRRGNVSRAGCGDSAHAVDREVLVRGAIGDRLRHADPGQRLVEFPGAYELLRRLQRRGDLRPECIWRRSGRLRVRRGQDGAHERRQCGQRRANDETAPGGANGVHRSDFPEVWAARGTGATQPRILQSFGRRTAAGGAARPGAPRARGLRIAPLRAGSGPVPSIRTAP